jgi:hypothetical protein
MWSVILTCCLTTLSFAKILLLQPCADSQVFTANKVLYKRRVQIRLRIWETSTDSEDRSGNGALSAVTCAMSTVTTDDVSKHACHVIQSTEIFNIFAWWCQYRKNSTYHQVSLLQSRHPGMSDVAERSFSTAGTVTQN